MLFDKKRIYKNNIALMLIPALIFTGLFSSTLPAHAITVEKTITKYHLDIGAQHIWGTGNSVETALWERGNNKGGPIDVRISLKFPQDVSNVRAYELTSTNFNWGQEGYSYNATTYLHNKDDYDDNYKQFASNSVYNITASSSEKTVNLSYSAILDSSEDFDLKTNLNMGRLNYILDMLGGAESVQEHYPDVYDRLVEGAEHGIADNVHGFMYFTPVVIAYDVVETVEIGDFEPGLDLPDKAGQGEAYTAADATIVDEVTEIDYAVLEKHYGDGSWEGVNIWNGPCIPGENTGGEVTESCDDVCTITYRLRVYDSAGQQKSVIKTIDINDSREISVTPILTLPTFTYEGHPTLAEDTSEFVVNGVDYSAVRAYAENIADNRFHTSGSWGSVARLTDTKADVTFSKAGDHTVKLTVDPISGSTVYDTKPIEVRKTPYIIDNLSGFQKQNRKQVLNIAVATYPGNPVTDFSITLKDKKTGDFITLTPGNLQENSAAIKTRAVQKTESDDGCFTWLTVEFLTKTPVYDPTDPGYTQDFSYDIHVEDSRRDTDTVSETFTVTPDIPPAAAVSIDSAFLRNEGTNTASIKVEDVTVAADGDTVERAWFYAPGTAYPPGAEYPPGTVPAAFTDVSSMAGYKKLSFGTDKIVGFNKAGVGKFTARLDVKELWTEPTLEEYVTDADRLTGSAVAYSDVRNVAPVVSLELLNSTEQKILLLANNDSEYQTLLNNKTALQQELLANKIDGQIIIKKLIGSTPETVTGVQQQRALTFPYPAKLRSDGLATEVDESGLLAVDSERTYFLTYTWTDGNPTVPKTVHAIRSFGSGEAWSYTTNRNEDFTFGQDDTGKYLYLIYKESNQTVLLDKRTGAAAGTINIALSGNIWLTDNLAFMVENGSLYAVDLGTLTKTKVSNGSAAVSRVGGNLQYIEHTANAVVRCTLDIKTFEISRDVLINTAPGVSASGDYIPVCIDSTGKAVLFKEEGFGTDKFRGFKVFSPENVLIREIPTPKGGWSTYVSVRTYAALDEQGRCSHVLFMDMPDGWRDTIYAGGIDINTGAVAGMTISGDHFWLPCAGAFQSGGTSYYMLEGWYTYPGGTDYRRHNYTFSFNGSSFGYDYSVPGVPGTPYAENIKVSDRTVAEFCGDNKPSTGTFTLKIVAFPKTLAQETAEIISRFTGKLTFLGNVNTTADQIKAAAEAPKSVVKVTAAKDGSLSLNNLSLLPSKKYYYEYDVKPLADGVKDRLTGITANTPTSTSPQSFIADTLYVTDSYEEDFNGGPINPFFTVNDPGVIADGYLSQYPDCKGYGALKGSMADGMRDESMKLSFTVPAGKQAVVTMDYALRFDNYYGNYNGNTNVLVDGMTIRDRAVYGNNTDYDNGYKRFAENAAGAVFHKLLGPGTHTVECKVSMTGSADWSYVLIDNLKVDILSTSPKASGASFNLAQGDSEDWLSAGGTFDVPSKVISYGAQTSSTYYGGMPSEVIGYDKYDYPSNFNYYQTVPAGYIQKGSVHYYVNYQRTSAAISISGAGAFNAGSYTSGWVNFGIPKTAGAYTHNFCHGSASSNGNNSGGIDVLDVVQYPDNSVTRTENMAFNSTNTKYFFPKVTSNQVTALSMFIPKGDFLIKNLRLYYIENGMKIYLQNKALENAAELPDWTFSSGLSAANYSETPSEEEAEPIKIYKKGERVLYNIFYDDYEEDPSKQQYWRYAHINWPPDGVHPDVGKVLSAPIDRFYLSGKYTVTHWQQDDTQRAGTFGDATPYNKLSNQVDLTFYVDGGGAAPWVTYIKTNPASVNENNTYTLAVGVDDAEKDILTLETEVYRDGKSIAAHKRENLQANAAGVYPETLIGGLPAAQTGVYQVICTVSDCNGTGVRAYKFTVVSEGRITGFVSHTEQWNANRKKYNLKRFSEEINRVMQLGDYTAMPEPRMRGVNVFWSGEKFMLRAETEGEPAKVTAEILSWNPQGVLDSAGYSAELTNTGGTTEGGAELWEGSLWDSAMINKWGRKAPEELTFRFTAHYSESITKNHTTAVIMDSERDYWQLHRLW